MSASEPAIAVETQGTPPSHPVPGGAGQTSLIGRVAQGPLGVLAAVIILFAVLVVVTPGVAAPINLQVLARSFSIAALVGLAQMIVIGSGGLDLSVGAIGGLVTIAIGGLMEKFGIPTPIAIAIALAIGAGCGRMNGELIVRTGLSPFIVTLAMGSFWTGINFGITQVVPFYKMPADFRAFGNLQPFGVPILLIVMLVVAGILWYLFRSVGLGKQILALGANPVAAELAGVPVKRVIVTVYTLSGLLAGCAAVLLTARLGSAQPLNGSDWLLNSFAVPIIGGTLLTGGYVSVTGTVLGAVLLALIANGLVFLNIDPYWVKLLQGAIILAAGGIDRARTVNILRIERAERRRL